VRNSAAEPVACVPAAIPAQERAGHFALAKKLFTEMAKTRQDLASGYEFQFEATALGAIARFVENERKCCPFMSFELEIAPASGPILLRLTGPDGTRAVLDAELNLLGSCSCGS
jgi:hypothetical protein